MKRLGTRGVTLMELMVVVAASVITMGIAGFSVQGLRDRNDAENQVRRMHSDMMNARVGAFERKMTHFVIVTTDGYQIVEDTNGNGGTMPDPGNRAFWPTPKEFAFSSQWSGTIIMDANGILSNSTGPLLDDDALAIRFDLADINPNYNCLSIGPTRIREGKWDGIKCAAR